MSDGADATEETKPLLFPKGEAPPASGDKLQLVVSTDGTFTTHRLPSAGTITIGRAVTNLIRIDHAAISRAHAVLTLGATFRLRDLGSSNGTRVAGHRLDPDTPVDVAPGDTIELGSVVLVIQRIAAALPPRRLLSHDYFETRVEEECGRRGRVGGTFSVVRIHAPPGAAPESITQTLHETLRAHDVLATYAPNEYEVMLDASPEQAAEVTERLRVRLAAAGLSVVAGIASYLRDGATAGALIAAANSAVQRSRPGRVPGASSGAPPARDETPMEGLRKMVERVAQSTISVLILGETGVGKEVLSETVHRLSPRARNTFLRLNCAALSESLLESELFGHERGAFTGAVAQKRGLLETADGGTILLDEVGELPLSMQVKLLRVLEERKVTRVGGVAARDIDVRFVSATNRDLEAEVQRGTFRQDLLFRLNGITIVVPPLRERTAEIAKLVQVFIAQAARDKSRAPALSAAALALLRQYSWPGNIRELRNVIERAVLLAGDDDEIRLEHLPVERMNGAMVTRPAPSLSLAPLALTSARPPSPPESSVVPSARPAAQEGGLKSEIELLERQRILEALEECVWNQTKAAQRLGMSRGTLVARLDQYGIARPRKGKSRE